MRLLTPSFHRVADAVSDKHGDVAVIDRVDAMGPVSEHRMPSVLEYRVECPVGQSAEIGGRPDDRERGAGLTAGRTRGIDGQPLLRR